MTSRVALVTGGTGGIGTAIVKRLASIHDLGAMDVLCTDKTGTLTEAKISLLARIGADGVGRVPAASPVREVISASASSMRT